jgi:hypothetical protein
MRLKVELATNPRVMENIILEVRALAQRYGLEVPDVKVAHHRAMGPRTKQLGPRRPRSSRGRRSPAGRPPAGRPRA